MNRQGDQQEGPCSIPSSSPSTRDNTSCKRVQFPSKPLQLELTRRISTISDRADDEISAVWGDEEEQMNRKKELYRDLHRILSEEEYSYGKEDTDESDDLNGSGLCTLGLLELVGDRAARKRQNREEAWDAVMWEQHNLFEANGEDYQIDYDEIARVYTEHAHTEDVQQQAQAEAKRLEKEIRELRRNDSELQALLLHASLVTPQ